jgi:hypothetical protein
MTYQSLVAKKITTFAQFAQKWGTDTPRMVVGNALAEPLNAQYRNLLTELLDDLAAATRGEAQ